jgi:Tfp pilus assembly protein PilV
MNRTMVNQTAMRDDEGGYSLVEVIIAMLVFQVVALGIVVAFTYAVSFNAGNNSRAMALAVMQAEVEVVRAAKFTPFLVDPIMVGGVKARKIVTNDQGFRFRVDVTVDDRPSTAGVQIDATSTLKDVAVTVSLDTPTPGWQTSIPATVTLRRTISN